MDEDLRKFEEITSGIEFDRRTKRAAKRAGKRADEDARRRALAHARAQRKTSSGGSWFQRLLAWAEDRAMTQGRPWAGR
jgi:hypothetical protein